MKDKFCSLSLVAVGKAEGLLSSLLVDISPGTDNMDDGPYEITARCLSLPICHILNRCFLRVAFPFHWKHTISLMSSVINFADYL